MASEEIDYYAILQVLPTATLQEIKTAYRQRSLKVHPDRNPDNPDAAALFHSLRQAADILLDPIQRTTFDSLQSARNARAERFKGLNSKRKAMAEDLQRREMEFKKSRNGLDEKRREEGNELDRLRDEGRKLREGRDKALMAEKGRDEEVERIREVDRERERKKKKENAGVVELGEMDLMLKIKFSRSTFPGFTSNEIVLNYLDSLLSPPSHSNINSFSSKNIEALILSSKFLSNPSKSKSGTGMISFKSLNAVAEVMSLQKKRKELIDPSWNGIELSWPTGSPPAILGLKSEGREEKSVPVVEENISSFPTSMLVDGDEDRILALLRAKERAKLIADLEKEDAELEG